MALVSKIREKSGLIVFVVGLGLLLFIIPFDSIYSFFGGSGEQPIGEIYGKSIYASEWDVMEEFTATSGQYSGVENGDMYKMAQAKNHFQVQMFDTIISTEVGKIGLQVSAAELKDYLIFGENPSSSVLNTVRQFYGLGDEVTEDVLKDSIYSMYNYFTTQLNSAPNDQKANIEKSWALGVEKPAIRERLISKYFAMAKYAVVGTADEATKSLIQQNSKLTIDFIAKEANTVSDSTVSVSEADVKAYYEAHKDEAQWKINEDVAKIDFVLINVDPTAEDEAETIKAAEKMKKGFAEADNDTSFIEIKSDITLSDAMQGLTSFEAIPGVEFDSLNNIFSNETAIEIMKAKEGEVVGPISLVLEGQKKIVLAKVRAVAEETKVRHILVTDQSIADSISGVLISDTSQFASLAEKFSTDPGFAQNGGYYDVGPATRFVPSFKEFALANGAGTIGVVPSQFGFHVIEVVSKGKEKRAMAYVVKNIEASQNTRNLVYEQQGFGFADAAKADFNAALAKFGFESLSATMYLSLPVVDLTGNNQMYNPETTVYVDGLTNWIFAEGRKTGDVSTPIELKDGRFLVAKVSGNGTYGVPTYEIVKDEMRAKLVTEAKIANIKKQLEKVGSLAEAEGIVGGTGATTDAEITLDMNGFPGVAITDVKSIARTFLIKNLNELTVIEGEEVVYAVIVKNRSITPIATDKSEAIASVSMSRQNYVDQTIQNALMKMADVRDWRIKAQVYANTAQ